MHRFFINQDQIKDNTIKIIDKDLKHIKDVLRLNVGDKIELISNGHVYIGEIGEINSKYIEVNIRKNFPGKNEANIDIILYQAIAKGDKMDYIIQKSVELGVKEIHPVDTHRTVVKFRDEKKKKKRLNRWQSISEEAAKQSKRDIIPKVNPIINFEEMIGLLEKEENIIVAYEGEENLSLKNVLEKEMDKVHVIIGPEGGFEDFEIEALKNINGKTVSLGPRILRTETAGIVVSSVILYEFGNLEMIK